MKSKNQKKGQTNHTTALNALLSKSEGDIANLSKEERMKLQQLCTDEIVHELNETYATLHPGVNPLIAALRDETYRGRTTQTALAKRLGISYTYYNKIVTGREHIGANVAKRIYRELGIDGNFILENI